MSSPTQNTASDNKNQKEVEVCEFSSTSSDFGNISAPDLNNLKKSTAKSSADGSTAAALLKEKELAANIYAHHSGDTSDSGFISGPQTSSLLFSEQQDEEDAEGAVGGDTKNIAQKFNITSATTPTDKLSYYQQNKEEQAFVLDSGCIDEEFAEDEYDEHETADTEQQHKANEQFERKQVQRELPNVAVAAIESDQMILKHNVDAGISERFCKLSLQSDGMSCTEQIAAGGIGLNNLNAAGKRKLSNSTSYREQQQQQQQEEESQIDEAAGTSATTSTASAATQVPLQLNAWEQFYQQNDDGDTPLHLACIFGYVDVVAQLIRIAPHPCLFNIQNDDAQTPLHLAALTTQPKILRMLLIAGAEPTMRDRHGNTPLHLACIAGEEQCVKALTLTISQSEIQEAHRQYGHRSIDKTVSYLGCANLPSDLEIYNYDGETCVHLAAQAGHIHILRLLEIQGADINARERKSGRTPLHIAIESCDEELANFLLDDCRQKLNLEAPTYAGLTAYQVACVLDKPNMLSMLEKRGAVQLTPPDSDYDSDYDIETDFENYVHFGDPGYFVNYNGGNPMTVA